MKVQKLKKTYESPLSPQVFKDYPTLFGDVDETTVAYLVYSNRETKFRVYFDSRNSIKGWWKGSNAAIQFTAPFTQILPATTNTNDKWGVLILSKDVDPFTPWLDITLSVGPDYDHTWLKATASLDIVYPSPDGSAFINQEEHLSQEVQLFVSADDDTEIQEVLKFWTYEPGWWEPWMLQLIALPPALILFVVGIIARSRQGR